MRPSAEPTQITCARGSARRCGSSAGSAASARAGWCAARARIVAAPASSRRPKHGTPALCTSTLQRQACGLRRPATRRTRRAGQVGARASRRRAARRCRARARGPGGKLRRRAARPAAAPRRPPTSAAAIARPMPPWRRSAARVPRRPSCRHPGAGHCAAAAAAGCGTRRRRAGRTRAPRGRCRPGRRASSIRSISIAKCATCSRSRVPCERR